MVIVGGLLIVALVLGVILLNSIGTNKSNANQPTSTLSLSSTTPTTPPTTDDGIPAAILAQQAYSFDPNGSGDEFDELLPNLFDQVEGSTWHTSCYLDRYLGNTKGVGIVLPLSEAGTGTLTVTFASKPWSVKIYTSDAKPTTLDGWGAPVSEGHSDDQTTGTFLLGPQNRSYVLVWLWELSESDNPCEDNPWQGEIAEISFTSGPGV